MIKAYSGPLAGSKTLVRPLEIWLEIKKLFSPYFQASSEDYQKQRMSPYIDFQIFVYFDKEIQDM